MSKIYVDELHPKTTGGAVTNPNLIAFEATVGTAVAVTEDTYTKVIFDTVAYNQGNAYNGSTGRFTAPVDGFYHLSADCMFSNLTLETARIIARFYKNGTNFRGRQVYQGSTAYDGTAHVSMSTYLQANDYIEVYVYHEEHNDSIIASPDWSFFNGFLVG